MGIAITAVLCSVFGFGVGLLTFKKAQQWCPECGATLTCADCRASGPAPPTEPPPESVEPHRNSRQRRDDADAPESGIGRRWDE
ncbi:hypothetical protein SAMN05444365_11467 [Micromonospora pattaloongensis]|uniref:Uncharacterized protein n=1 Tax=Micromonospora pattaloongensis TaxID=405436 RepID=A0A1H3SVL6_9ACTN|nr:hypothetical protein [Micromonospora pattaloongensis]SDZ41757.1 hypothetical protein SAMN05444365_11467 [Micromonospora pattaloongensis]